MKLAWTREDKIRIVERYWGSGSVRCPQDGAVLNTIKSQAIGQSTAEIHFLCPHCGRSFWSKEVEKGNDPESFAATYEDIRQLGAGGMGTVSMVRHRASGEVLAAKRIRPEFLNKEIAVKRFRRECRIFERLDHPKVLPVRETFLDDRGGVIIMPYVAEGTLKGAINNRGIGERRLLSYFADVVEGLRYLHSAGVIHRDLKPDNVLLDSANGGVARISDFGLARLVDRDTTTLTVYERFLGTRWYSAPEQQNAKDVTPRCDIYSLGLIAFEVATRQSPYQMPVNVTGLAAELQESISRCLNNDPTERPGDGDALLRGLKAHLLRRQDL